MTLSGYSKDTGHAVTKDTFEPSDKNIDAERLEPQDLIKLFEPNEGDGDSGICSYDRIAKAAGPYYLVAERGVGKTHTLGLLGVILEERGDTLLKIELKENPILAAFEKLKKEMPDAQKEALWQVAILEEASLALAEKYLNYLETLEFKGLPDKKRKSFEKDFKNGLTPFYAYLRKYRKEDWGKYHRLERAFRESGAKAASFLGKILTNIHIQLSPISLGVLPAVQAPPASKPEVEEPPENTLTEKELIVLSGRIIELENWFWGMLRLMNRLDHRPRPDLNARLTRNLPNVHSLYIIADGLDQTSKPMSHRDLIALKNAARFLNRKTTTRLKNVRERNFKLIVSFRAVTFNYYIKPKDKDAEQEYSDIDTLRWNNPALLHMMSKRIRESDDSLSPALTVDEVIQSRFPPKVHYMSREFSPTPEFFFHFAGFRPRQVILLWQSCAGRAGYQDHPYNVSLTEDQIVLGLKDYSIGILPEDIIKEYQAEYSGLEQLLNHFATLPNKIDRDMPLEQWIEIISNYFVDYERQKKKAVPRWMRGGAEDVVDTLYKIGLIGVPVDRLDTDWPRVTHVYDDAYLKASKQKRVYVRPPLWNFLTNIQDETKQRRVHMHSLYSMLKESAFNLKNSFDLNAGRNRAAFERELCRFLMVGKAIRDNARYAEPVDWRLWTDTSRAIERSWEALYGLTNWSETDAQSAIARIDGIADQVTPYLLDSHDTRPDAQTISGLETFGSMRQQADYSNAIAPLGQLLADFENSKEPQSTAERAFYLSLFKGSQSLDTVLKTAEEKLKLLI